MASAWKSTSVKVGFSSAFRSSSAVVNGFEAYYLDGRVSALWGTHTHVPAADEEVFPKGTGYLTDLGMTGAVRSVLGIEPQQSVETFLGGLAGRYRAPEGLCKLQGAVFSLDSDTGLCVGVERVDVR